MLLDLPTPYFSKDLKLRFVNGYAGFRCDEVAKKQVEPTEKPYSPRIQPWMRRQIEMLVVVGTMTNYAIAKQLGISQGQVNYTSRRLFLRKQGQKHL